VKLAYLLENKQVSVTFEPPTAETFDDEKMSSGTESVLYIAYEM